MKIKTHLRCAYMVSNGLVSRYQSLVCYGIAGDGVFSYSPKRGGSSPSRDDMVIHLLGWALRRWTTLLEYRSLHREKPEMDH